MPKSAPVQNNFNSGELSPLLGARTDVDRIKAGVALCQRYIPTIQGGVTKCPGTKYIVECSSLSSSDVLNGYYPLIVRFEFSNTQAYILEFGDQTVRIIKDRAQVTSGASAYSITSPYSYDSFGDMQFFQSNDVLYITHTNFAPRKLVRRGETDWYFEAISFEDGPYLPITYPTTARPGIVSSGTGGTASINSFLTTITSVASQSGSTYRIVTATPHYFNNGENIAIDGVVGSVVLQSSVNNSNVGALGFHSITTVSSTSFDVISLTGTVTNGYASAGSVYWNAFGQPSNNIGRLVRIKQVGSPNEWVWGTVATASTSHYGKLDFITLGTNSLDAGTHQEFRLGVWRVSAYPATATIHEDRLTFYGAPLDPARVDMSNSADYENFAPSDEQGSVVASNAISFPLASNGVQVGVWLASDEKGLLAGSEGQEWIVRPSVQAEALSPTNVSAKPSTSQGGIGGMGAVKVGKAALFVQRAGRKLMEYQYFYDVDGFRTEDLTQLAEHITLTGIKQIALQKVPQQILWAVRNDGVLLGLTYERTQEITRFGWHRHPIGGYSNANGDPAKVVSIAVIPTPDGTSEELYMVVQRWINGATRFYIEYMTQFFDDSVDMQDAFFVDAGLTYNSPLTISSVSSVATNSVLFTVTSHGLSNGDRILVDGIVGMSAFNEGNYLVSAASTNTFILQTTGTVNVAFGSASSSGVLSYISNGSVCKYVSTVSGLGHLEGQAVDCLANGTAVSGLTVSGSAVVISGSTTKAHIGLNYVSRIKTLRFDSGAADGTSMGKYQRSSRMGILFDNTGVGVQIGRDFDNLLDVPLDDADLPLFSGFKSESFEDDYTRDNRVCIQHSEPTPSTILAILPNLVTQDGG